jgi:DNA-binding NarL/FixJ family response regulator
MARILILDGCKMARSSLRAILRKNAGWEVVTAAENGKDGVAKAIETQPDVVIIDYAPSGMNVVEIIDRIHAYIPKAEILVLTPHQSDELIEQLQKAGARGHMIKSDAKQYLIPAVETLADRKPFFVGNISKRMLPHHREREVALSSRERVIVRLISEGLSNKEIGEVLDLSVKTIEDHRAAAMGKLGLKSTAALVRYAVRNGLVVP